MAHSVGGGCRRQDDSREAALGLAFDAHHAGHGESRWVDAVNARGVQDITHRHIGVRGHKAQFHGAAFGHAAVGCATLLRAAVEHWDRGVFVGQQRDFGGQGVQPRHLAEHAGLVDDGRADDEALCSPPIDEQLA